MDETNNLYDRSRKDYHKIAGFVVAALLLATGISVGGYFVGNMMYKTRIATNLATVKGLAEREVKADTAIWNVEFEANEYDLIRAYAHANEAQEKVTAYLKKSGFSDAELSKDAFSVIKEDERDDKGKRTATNYRITGVISLRTNDVDKLAAAAQNAGDLVGEGVMLGSSKPQYVFTKLNDIKPEMLGEATRNARVAAEQFAKDANEKVGAINSAEQGAFNFSARDSAGEQGGDDTGSIFKKVRVVTTISFYLKD